LNCGPRNGQPRHLRGEHAEASFAEPRRYKLPHSKVAREMAKLQPRQFAAASESLESLGRLAINFDSAMFVD
jgi:hypothetical protein